MKNLILLTIILMSMTVYAQKKVKKTPCTEVLNELSFFWKIDSLGTNGFRLYTYDKLLSSKLDTVKPSFLISKLGNPNDILKSSKDVTYIYFYLNPTKMSKDFEAPLAIFYLGFIQKKGDELISQITKWSFDL